MIAIRNYRLKLNMTQRQLAEKLGVSKSAVAQWELGTRTPSVIFLKRIAEILNCRIDDLIAE